MKVKVFTGFLIGFYVLVFSAFFLAVQAVDSRAQEIAPRVAVPTQTKVVDITLTLHYPKSKPKVIKADSVVTNPNAPCVMYIVGNEQGVFCGDFELVMVREKSNDLLQLPPSE